MSANIPGATGSESSSSGDTTQTTSAKWGTPPKAVIEYFLTAFEESSYVEIPLKAEEGQDVEAIAESGLDAPWGEVFDSLHDAGVETISVEDFFGVELDAEYFSRPALLTTGTGKSGEFDSTFEEVYGCESLDQFLDKFEEHYGDGWLRKSDGGVKAKIPHPEFAEEVSKSDMIGGVTGNIRGVVNANYWPAVFDRLEDDARVKVGKARTHADGRDSWPAVESGEYSVENDMNRVSHAGFKVVSEDPDGVLSDIERDGGDVETFGEYQEGEITVEEAAEEIADE